MLKVIGNTTCFKCKNVKRMFEANDINFKYTNIEDMPEEEQEQVKDKAIMAEIRQFPIVIQVEDDEVITIGEAMRRYGIS